MYYDPAKRIGTPKYAAVLPRLKDHHQLLVHSIGGDFSPHTDAIIGRQFLPIKLAWQRGTFERKYADVVLDPDTRVRDEVLAAAFARTFA